MLKSENVVLLATLLFVFGFVATVNADTIYVPDDYSTIQEGIDAANDMDVVIVGDGEWTGPLNKNLDFGGKAITVRSENGLDNCIIDCEDDGRGFFFHSGEGQDSVVDGFTITSGLVEGSGGGIRCESGSSPTITNCMIMGNMADDGGGVCCYNSNPTITNCTITGNNTAGNWGFGGGVCCVRGSPMITNCTISGNSGCYGGGILCENDSSPAITNCMIMYNTADIGGGINCSQGSQVITNCTISGNSALAGGGILCWGRSSPTIANCIISGNSSIGGCGGGICTDNYKGDVTITNCIISGNSAGYTGGGGLYCRYGTVTIVNCTITGNIAYLSSGRGGGIYCDWDSGSIVNCVLWNDTASAGPEIALTGGTLSVSYSDIAGGEAAVYVDEAILVWGNGNIDINPLFFDPDGPDDDPNTWEDNDYHLSAGSPCIDGGCNWGVPRDAADLDEDGDTDEFTPLDLDGEGRFFDDPDTGDTGCGCPPIVDMGAYEFGDTGPQPCPGDLDCDRVVGHSDLGTLLGAWNWSDGGDLDCDGDTDHADLGILLADWGCGT